MHGYEALVVLVAKICLSNKSMHATVDMCDSKWQRHKMRGTRRDQMMMDCTWSAQEVLKYICLLAPNWSPGR